MEKKDIALLEISKIIVHDVPRHRKGDTSPQIDYSEKESNLTQELKTFFKDKLVEIINKKSYRVFYNTNSISPIPSIIYSLNNSSPRNDLIEPSKRIAKHLYDIQKGTNPAGIVVIIEGMINGNNIISILKVERDEGAKIEKNTAHRYIDIVTVKDLLLTKKTKLFKASIFFNRTDYNVDYDGYVADNQLQISSMKEVADFFLSDFLGCEFYDDTRILTKNFFECTQSFISKIEDPIKKAKYYEHLLSYTNKPTSSISFLEFSNEYLEIDDRQNYEDYMIFSKFPEENIRKDTELINSHIKRMMIDFDNDVSVISKKGDLGNKIKLSPVEEGMTKAEIIGKIKKIGS